MQVGDDAFARLRRTIDELADQDVAELVAEARLEARAKVRTMLVDALAQALLDRTEVEIARSQSDPPQGTSAPRAVGGRGADTSPPPARPHVSARPKSPPEPSRSPKTRTPTVASGGATEPGELGLYVYCVVGGEDIATIAELRGVDGGAAVSVVREGPLGALATRVPLDRFGEAALRDRLGDVAWLEQTARAHERVLDHVRERTTVIPMRLCTIYHSEASVRDMLRREHAALSEALARLAGKTEWGVKVFVSRAELERRIELDSPLVGELVRQLANAGEGEGYLLRRRLEQIRSEELERLLEERCEEAHGQLSGTAVEALLNPLQPPEVTNHPGEMVLNGVYLVEDSATAAFHAAVESVEQAYGSFGFELALTGPWPPYNFVKGSIEAAW